jgi:S-adenosylmethionine:tRNA ribosyltransferase-isomerase
MPLRTTDFSFDLPPDLIAQVPGERRGGSRLLVLDRESGRRDHRRVIDLPDLVEPGTLMVFNDSRVRKARVFGRPEDGAGEVEFLLLDRREAGCWRAMAKRAKRQRPGRRYRFADELSGEIVAEEGEFRLLRFDRDIDEAWFERNGHIPLPPYIKRKDAPQDAERYQTVYSRATGSAAAPTAGLHFTEELLDALRAKGIETAYVTLHVGLGTFLPVRTETIESHQMHEESYTIGEEAAVVIERARAEGRPIMAVGTTTVRTLESAWNGSSLNRGPGRTSIFIYPGYRFRIIDRLFTNFHTPQSTLLMLVCAFAGTERVLGAYDEAVRERYRFFSYGDAMLIR